MAGVPFCFPLKPLTKSWHPKKRHAQMARRQRRELPVQGTGQLAVEGGPAGDGPLL